jgi:spermidine/putrescine-binding protein
MKKLRLLGLLLGMAMLVAVWALPALAGTTTAHSSTINVVCSGSGFTVDANAFQGQKTEVTAFYKATGIVCRLFDGASGALLFDPRFP